MAGKGRKALEKSIKKEWKKQVKDRNRANNSGGGTSQSVKSSGPRNAWGSAKKPSNKKLWLGGPSPVGMDEHKKTRRLEAEERQKTRNAIGHSAQLQRLDSLSMIAKRERLRLQNLISGKIKDKSEIKKVVVEPKAVTKPELYNNKGQRLSRKERIQLFEQKVKAHELKQDMKALGKEPEDFKSYKARRKEELKSQQVPVGIKVK